MPPPPAAPAPTTTAQLKDQLVAQGVGNYAIYSSSGQPVEFAGVFDDKAKRDAGFSIIQNTSHILKQGEKLKRVTVTFEEGLVFTASVASIGGKTYGIIVQQK